MAFSRDSLKIDDAEKEIDRICKAIRDWLSHHLKRLVDAGLLTTRSEGTYHYYAADYATLRSLTEYLWEDCCKRGKGSCC